MILLFIFQLFFCWEVSANQSYNFFQVPITTASDYREHQYLDLLRQEDFLSFDSPDDPLSYLLSFSHKNSLSFEEGVEAMMALFDAVHALQYSKKTVDERKLLQRLHNKIHNRLYLHTQIARLKQEIKEIQEKTFLESFLSFWEKEEKQAEVETVLILKKKALERYQSMLEGGDLENKLLGEKIVQYNFEVRRLSKYYYKSSRYRLEEELARRAIKLAIADEVRQAKLMINYIQLIPFDLRNKTHNKQLKWAGEILWFHDLYTDFFSGVRSWMLENSIPSLLDFSLPASISSIRESSMSSEIQSRLIQFIYTTQEILKDPDRIFGSLIQVSSLAQGLQIIPEKEESLYHSEQEFLLQLGIEEMEPQNEFMNLSHLYGPIRHQNQSAACMGFSVADDIQFELHQKGSIEKNEFISPFALYGELQAYSKGEYPFNYEVKPMEGIRFELLNQAFQGLSQSSGVPLLTSYSYQERVLSYIKVKGYQIYRNAISFKLLRVLIENNKPPILLLNTDTTDAKEDWQMLQQNGNGNGHSVVVIGYGMYDKINPFTLKREPYLIIRDSLPLTSIHYKVSAENLLEFVQGLIKITEVE